MKREFLQELRVGDSALPKEVVDAIMAENGKDIQNHKLSAQQWEEKYNRAVSDHTAQMAKLQFDSYIQSAVSAHRGRSLKAITALLDVEALRQSGEAGAVATALEQLKTDCGYLFCQAAPAYAVGTGAQVQQQGTAPATLAGALRERFEKNK